jgi:hypothetical protein
MEEYVVSPGKKKGDGEDGIYHTQRPGLITWFSSIAEVVRKKFRSGTSGHSRVLIV